MKILIIGGAGFIGCNSALYFLEKGYKVTVFDNLNRSGSHLNLEEIKGIASKNTFSFVHGDIRNFYALDDLFQNNTYDYVLHLAGQVAVTTSVNSPREDFEINALGTLNVLEAMRGNNSKAGLIYTSTNKVYGGMERVRVKELSTRYEYENLAGVPETFTLDFHSPYGCSKGSADQYVRDYARIYGLKTVVFRQSCIYGKRQFGIEDQGWVAWFSIASILEKNITIFGTGKQLRDVLYVDDLVEAYEKAFQNIDAISGNAYNIGGGKNQLSLIELLSNLEILKEKEIDFMYDVERPGDQKVFVSDIRKAYEDFGWVPKTSPEEGVRKMYNWIEENKELF